MYFIIIFFFASTMWYYDCYFHIICLFSFIITHLIIYFVLRIFFMLFCFVFDEMRQRQSRIMTHSKIVSVVWVFAWIIHESTYFSSFFHFFSIIFFFFFCIIFLFFLHYCIYIINSLVSANLLSKKWRFYKLQALFCSKSFNFSHQTGFKCDWSWISVLVKRWIQSVHWWLSYTIAMCVCFFLLSNASCLIIRGHLLGCIEFCLGRAFLFALKRRHT